MRILKCTFRKRSIPPLPDLPDPIEQPEPTPQPKPKDPARIAASVLLHHALRAGSTKLAEAGRDGAITVIMVPSLEWSAPLQDVSRIEARANERYEDGFRRGWNETTWLAWAPVGPEREYALKEADETFARAVADGRHCLAIATDKDWLPRDFILSADHRLALGVLSGADIKRIARELCGDEPAEAFVEDLAATITPRLLRLGRRLGQTADNYILMLQDLAIRDRNANAQAAKQSPSSIRKDPTLLRLHGMSEATKWGMTLAKEMQQYRNGELPWADVDAGLLLSGPPGCGKTLYARALATTCNVPLVTGGYYDWYSSGRNHQGDLLKAMKQTFKTARDLAPSVLFLDEVDSFPNRSTIRHDHKDWAVQVVNALLAEVDGVSGREGVVLVGALQQPRPVGSGLDPKWAFGPAYCGGSSGHRGLSFDHERTPRRGIGGSGSYDRRIGGSRCNGRRR